MGRNKRGRGEPYPPTEDEVRALDDEALLARLLSVANHFDWAISAAETRNAEETEKVCRAEVLRRMACARGPVQG